MLWSLLIYKPAMGKHMQRRRKKLKIIWYSSWVRTDGVKNTADISSNLFSGRAVHVSSFYTLTFFLLAAWFSVCYTLFMWVLEAIVRVRACVYSYSVCGKFRYYSSGPIFHKSSHCNSMGQANFALCTSVGEIWENEDAYFCVCSSPQNSHYS